MTDGCTPGARDIVVGMSELAVSADRSARIVTYALGSCIAVALYDPVARVGGMTHSMLPLSKDSAEKARATPLAFTDLAVSELLAAMFEAGARRRSIRAVLAGAASAVPGPSLYRIGERNHVVARRVLWKNEVLVAAEDCGGAEARSLFLDLMDGRVCVRTRGCVREL